MQYFLTFLEGVISFISPCMLPMLPIYVSYFAGGADKKQKVFLKALSFVLGFTTVFCVLGLFSGTVGLFLTKYQVVVNIISGLIVILFGLSFMEIIHLPFFKGVKDAPEVKSIFSAFLFGVVFSINLTPCVGAFLGAALMMASSSGGAIKGLMLLLSYSMGLGITFLVSAILIENLNVVFVAIKKHYRIINIVCGVFLIIVGISMMFGLMNNLLNFMM